MTVPIFQKGTVRPTTFSGLLRLLRGVEVALEHELSSFQTCSFLYAAPESLFSKTEEPSDMHDNNDKQVSSTKFWLVITKK